MTNYKRMTVWFTKGQKQFIHKIAKKRGVSGSALLREVIIHYENSGQYEKLAEKY